MFLTPEQQVAEWLDLLVHLAFAPGEVQREALADAGAPQDFIQEHLGEADAA